MKLRGVAGILLLFDSRTAGEILFVDGILTVVLVVVFSVAYLLAVVFLRERNIRKEQKDFII